MRHPPETPDFRDVYSLPGPQAAPVPTPAHGDTAGWQALYQAMLGHITGNVEVWLKNYLAELMGSTSASRAPGSAATEATRAGVASAGAAGTAIQFVIPPWLEPFKDPANVRFTRTPDHILRQEKTAWPEVAASNDDALAPPPVSGTALLHVVEVPLDRRPFVPAPGVRYTRTPDRVLQKTETAPTEQTAPADNEGAAEEPATPEVSLQALVDDAFAMACAAEADEGRADPGDAAGLENWPDAPPQPWGDIIQLGPLEQLAVAAEQDRDPIPDDELVSSHAVPVLEDDAAEAQTVADDDTVEKEGWISAVAGLCDQPTLEEQPLDPVAVVQAEAGIAAAEPADADAFEAAVVAAPDVASPVPPALGEAVRPPVSADNALHMAFLGGLTVATPVRRPRLAGTYEHPPLELLAEPKRQSGNTVTRDALEQHARLLEGVLEDFGIRGEIINVRPGPVVTLYELEPAPGIKSSRVVGLADDIARSMSAISARVAVVQGRNAIGIELPNQQRDMVFLRELLAEPDFDESKQKLAIALGKTIGGEPVIVDLARMPHLLVAGTTGSGKSVAINTMILSLLYRLKPEECRLIMVDPKMLELSIYDGIPHLLTPVVTDPKKAVIALKWAVREMEDRYKKMSKVGVRNIDGFNARVTEAKAKGETIVRSVHTGFDRHTGQATYASEEMDLTSLPYIVIIVDEMADLMMVAGKDIEGAIQRLAQMARAAGIHLIMATQRPSVDVITGTIKANFPTRISFQVTSKIDSRTILGEQGAEQLLGQGDMLHMMGGGRIARVHGPFVSDGEVELVVNHLKAQGQPDYLDVTTEENEAAVEAVGTGGEEEGGDAAVFDKTAMGGTPDDGDLYDQAVKIVLRDKKCSTSYIQRRLSVGYNKAASLVEKMEKEGIVGPANHAGKREILIYSRDVRAITITMPEDDDDA